MLEDIGIEWEPLAKKNSDIETAEDSAQSKNQDGSPGRSCIMNHTRCARTRNPGRLYDGSAPSVQDGAQAVNS